MAKAADCVTKVALGVALGVAGAALGVAAAAFFVAGCTMQGVVPCTGLYL